VYAAEKDRKHPAPPKSTCQPRAAPTATAWPLHSGHIHLAGRRASCRPLERRQNAQRRRSSGPGAEPPRSAITFPHVGHATPLTSKTPHNSRLNGVQRELPMPPFVSRGLTPGGGSWPRWRSWPHRAMPRRQHAPVAYWVRPGRRHERGPPLGEFLGGQLKRRRPVRPRPLESALRACASTLRAARCSSSASRPRSASSPKLHKRCCR
jgi:hypothetical protein